MRMPRHTRRWLVASGALMVAAIAAGSCNLHNPGATPPPAALSYPTALALSREANAPAKYLYVANSNFDLRYNAGSVQSYSLERLKQVLDKNGCILAGDLSVTFNPDGTISNIDAGTRSYADNTTYMNSLLDASLGDGGVSDAGDAGAVGAGGMDASIELPANYDIVSNYGNARGFLCDGRDPSSPYPQFDYSQCCFDNQQKLDAIRQSAFEIDSFAVGVAVAPDNNRVYVPVSSKNQLVYFDMADGVFSCGTETERCRRGPGLDSPDNVAYDNFPGALSEITIGMLSDLLLPDQTYGVNPNQVYLATTHDLGAVGLFLVPPDASGAPGAPILDGTVRGIGQRPRSITADPRTKLLYVTSAGDSLVYRIGLRITPDAADGDNGNVPGPRELLYESSRINVTGVSQAQDLRDLALDPQDPNKLYVLIRATQESIGFLQIDPTLPNTNAQLIDEVRIGAGPSKMILIQQDGSSFLLVTCYDEKSLYIVDAATHLLVNVVRSFSGPFTMTYDPDRRLLYVADFRASIMRVVDLAGVTDKTKPPPRIVGTIGSPQFQGALQ